MTGGSKEKFILIESDAVKSVIVSPKSDKIKISSPFPPVSVSTPKPPSIVSSPSVPLIIFDPESPVKVCHSLDEEPKPSSNGGSKKSLYKDGSSKKKTGSKDSMVLKSS